MTLSTALAGVLSGLLLGGLYAVAALGLSMVFGVMRLVNLVHGDLLILADVSFSRDLLCDWHTRLG